MARDNKKIRVLEVVSGLSTEGIGSLLLNVYENMDKEDVEISFALATKYEQLYEKRLINQEAKIYRTSENRERITDKVKHYINLIKIIKKEGGIKWLTVRELPLSKIIFHLKENHPARKI